MDFYPSFVAKCSLLLLITFFFFNSSVHSNPRMMVVISSDRSLSIIYMRSRMAPSLELIQSFSIDTQTRTHSLSCRALLCPALPCTSSAIDPVVVLLTTIKTPPHNRWPFTNKKEPSVLCLQLGSPSVFFFFSFLSHDQLLTQPAATNG